MKRELERWGERLSAEEDTRTWIHLRAAVRDHRRSTGWPGMVPWVGSLAATLGLVAAVLLLGRTESEPPVPSAAIPEAVVGSLDRAAVPESEPVTIAAADPVPGAVSDTVKKTVEVQRLPREAWAVAFGEARRAVGARLRSPPVVAQSRVSKEKPVPGRGELNGSVRDAVSGRPLTPANILVMGTSWGAMTLEDGSFRIPNLPPGTYDLQVQMMGYGTEILRDVEMRPDHSTTATFELAQSLVATLGEVEVRGKRKKIERSSTRVCQGVIPNSPVDDVEEVISLQAGVIAKSKASQLRGADGEASQLPVDVVPARDPLGESSADRAPESPPGKINAFAPPEPRRTGSVSPHRPSAYPSGTGGNRPVNARLADDMFFRHEGTNPFLDPGEDSLSTFGLDVDTGSYTMMRAYLAEGRLPPRASVRVEEFVNFFPKSYPAPEVGDFAIHVDGMPSPFAHVADDCYQLLRIGIRARDLKTENRPPMAIALVIDTSGSMKRGDRLGMVKTGLEILLDELLPDDRIAIVTFSRRGQVELPLERLGEGDRARRIIRGLRADGSTNVGSGLYFAYEMLRGEPVAEQPHQILLFSDGVANVDKTGFREILDEMKRDSDHINLSTFGVGMGNYNDTLLEQLADAGDGRYAYIDNTDEAVRVLRETLPGTLHLVARNAKAQIVFDPDHIDRYRLLGYENRSVRDQDFRNNRVDAGEVGAGHEVTVLYEIRVKPTVPPGPLATIHLRYEKPERGSFVELEEAVVAGDIVPTIEESAPDLRLDACVAEFAEVLRGSYWAKESTPASVLDLLHDLPGDFRERELVAEFVALVEKAGGLHR